MLLIFSVTIIAATYTVANIDDSGAGSLRQALLDANSNVGADTIIFSITGTIQPTSALPALSDVTGGTTIYAGLNHDVEIDGLNTSNTSGITITSSNNIISGLVINSFSGFDIGGIEINGKNASENIIINNYLGTDTSGTTHTYLSKSQNGIVIINGAHSNIIGGIIDSKRNIISRNYWGGIRIRGKETCNNIIKGNYIGTDLTGAKPLGNTFSGICIIEAHDNTIGGTEKGARNIISGNGFNGISLYDGAYNNTIRGNFIGADVTGTKALGNRSTGICTYSSGANNVIGGQNPGARNIISGNNYHGICIGSNSKVIGNYIGTDITGTISLGNYEDGIVLNGSDSIIGGKLDAGNIISGNGGNGMSMGNASNEIIGNYIGTDFTGTFALGNKDDGIWLASNSKFNKIGGTEYEMANIIAYNGKNGVSINGTDSEHNLISGNSIFENGKLGIDLNNDGITLNDIDDSDIGPNDLINSSVITNIIQIDINQYTVSGIAAPHTRVELYITNEPDNEIFADPSGNGEGYKFLNSINTNFSGNFIFTDQIFPAGSVLSTLSIDKYGNTSEFSRNYITTTHNTATITVAMNNLAPDSALQGNSVLMADFELKTDDYNAIFSNLKVEGNNPNINSNIGFIEIYADNGDGIFSSTADPLIGREVFSNYNSNIDIINQNITTTTSTYFIVAGINSNANIGETFSISISNTSDFTIISPYKMEEFTEFTSDSVKIEDGPDMIEVIPFNVAPPTVKAGTKNVLMQKISIYTCNSNETATLSYIHPVVFCYGNDVVSLKIYLDSGDDKFSVEDDTIVETFPFFLGEQVNEIIAPIPKTYFICLDISENANIGNIIGVSFFKDSLYVQQPDTVSNKNFPFYSGSTRIINYGNTINDIKIFPNPWTKNSNTGIIFTNLTKKIEMKIYTITGNLLLERSVDGEPEWEWDLTNENGKSIASGIYICHISNDANETRLFKIAVIK